MSNDTTKSPLALRNGKFWLEGAPLEENDTITLDTDEGEKVGYVRLIDRRWKLWLGDPQWVDPILLHEGNLAKREPEPFRRRQQ